MWVLIIDGEEIRENEFVKPLIQELDYFAGGDSFKEATIKYTGEED